MSVILQPQASFPIVRQIGNHTDPVTYYVRAVVRNASGTTIDTVNLEAQGEQRYQTSWQVPADATGHGVYISIVTSVYTDAGYTTKSENYSDEENTYLVFDRVLPAMRGGGGGGLDSRTVRRIIQEELDKLPKPEKVEIPEPEMRWEEVLEAVQSVTKAMPKIPKQEKVDLSSIASGIQSVMDTIGAQQFPETDLNPVLESLESLSIRVSEEQGQLRQELTQTKSDMESQLQTLKESVEKAIQDIQSTEFTFKAQREKKEKEEEPIKFDLSKLSL